MKKVRRQFFFFLVVLLVTCSCSSTNFPHGPGSTVKPMGPVILSFGAIADCQYSSESGNLFMNRYYSRSKGKLKQSLISLNSRKPDFVIHLGDLIDRKFKNYDVILPLFGTLSMPVYHVLGNHDFSVADDKKLSVPRRLGMKNRYYDFSSRGWRFVVLDGNEISFHAWPRASQAYQQSRLYYIKNRIKSPEWNGAVGPEQLRWLKRILKESSRKKEKVIVFCHYPVYPPGNNHNLWNAAEVVSLLEADTCVKAFMSGHDHRGGYASKKGIHYFTLPAMVETKKKTSFAIIHLYNNALVIRGEGRCPDMVLPY